jgi:hypothetical protein
MPATLPVEMWTEIVHYSPLPRHMLHVSRLLHDIVIRRLFSTLKIYFMHGEPGFFMLNTENERYVRETSDYLLNRSWELLHCIITDPAFASAVKTLSVHAFTDGPAVFEHRKPPNVVDRPLVLIRLYRHSRTGTEITAEPAFISLFW